MLGVCISIGGWPGCFLGYFRDVLTGETEPTYPRTGETKKKEAGRWQVVKTECSRGAEGVKCPECGIFLSNLSNSRKFLPKTSGSNYQSRSNQPIFSPLFSPPGP